jgi:hypothetical protein
MQGRGSAATIRTLNSTAKAYGGTRRSMGSATLPPVGAGRVVDIDPGADRRWEAFVASHPDALVYHHPAWLRALELEYGQKSSCLACEDDQGRLRGVLPLLHTRGLPLKRGGELTGRRLSSLPRTPAAGPLALDAAATAALLRAAVERVREKPGTRLQLKMTSDALDGLLEGLVGSPWRPWYVLELPARPDEIRFGNARNHARIRSAVRIGAKQGVEIRRAETKEELRSWYDLYLESLRWHAVPPRAFRFFEAVWDLLVPRGMMRLLLAELSSRNRRELLAGSIFFTFGDTFVYAFNGRQRRIPSTLRPNDALQWHAIHEACAEGFRWYDLGEVAEGQAGLHIFKSKWGAERTWLYRYYYPAPTGESETHEMDSRARRLAQAVWQRLPLRVTAFVGSRLYRYL